MRLYRSYFVFGGRSSLDYGLTIEQPSVAKKPTRKITRLSLPGRSRDFLVDNESYDNVDVVYQVWCADKSDQDLVLSKVGEIYSWLAAGKYQVLSDTYDPDYFRLGWCSEAIDPDIICRTHARQDIVFCCDPYRYSWQGTERQCWHEPAITLYNSGEPSLPYIKINGSGTFTLTVTGESDTWSAELTVDDYIELDSAEMDTTKGAESRNHQKKGAGYPTFGRGAIKIEITQWDGNYKGIEIVPRWRRL